MSLPPGPPVSGYLLAVPWVYRPFDMLDTLARRYGDAFSMPLPRFRAAVFHHPDVIKEVFSARADEVHAGEVNSILRPFLGAYSLLVLDGPEHLRQRRLLLPPFHGERMASYGERMIAITQASIDAWPEGREFPIQPRLQAITLEIILRVIFGIEQADQLAGMRERIVSLLDAGMNPWLLLPLFQRDLGPRSPWGRFQRMLAESDAMLYAEIRRRRDEGGPRRDDILSLLLDARDEEGKPMTDLELRDGLVTLLVAGHETTATALSWALRWILASPAVYTRLQGEIEDGGLEGGALSPARLAALPLLDAALREALRLQPVVPMVGRVLQRPFRLGGYDLDAGTPVLLSIYLAQRRPDLYPDPRRFDPDRFLRRKYGPNEWLPFGGGIRRCLGMAFALYEMKMILGTVLARTTLRRPAFGRVHEVRRNITIAPSNGLPVLLARRAPRVGVAAAP